ncbi:hypothetical protein HKD37_08G021068 [Glycine soja]
MILFFDHINHQSMTKVMTKAMVRVLADQRHLRPNITNLDQQYNVQLPNDALEVDMAFDEKTQCIRAVKEYNMKNHFDCRIIYSDQKRLNFRSSHLSRVNAHTRSSTTRQTRHSIDHPTNCQNKPNRLHQDVDCRDQNIHQLYHILQEDMVSKAKRVGDDSWKLRRIICQPAKTFGSFAILTVVDAQLEFVYEGGEIVPDKRMFKRIFWSFGPCINGFAYCKPIVQVDGTWLKGKYNDTLLIVTTQEGANHIFPIAYAIVTHTRRKCTGNILGISVRISQVQLNGLIN